MAVATEVIRRSMSTLAGLFTKKLPAGIWQFTFEEVGKGMKYVVNGRRYEFMAINGVMGITIDATNEKQLWYVISDDCTVQIEEVGQSANPFFSKQISDSPWTPACVVSLTSSEGYYSVIAYFSVVFANSADSNPVTITGLPFLALNTSGFMFGAYTTYTDFGNPLSILIPNNGQVIKLYQIVGGTAGLTYADMSAKHLRGCVIYRKA